MCSVLCPAPNSATRISYSAPPASPCCGSSTTFSHVSAASAQSQAPPTSSPSSCPTFPRSMSRPHALPSKDPARLENARVFSPTSLILSSTCFPDPSPCPTSPSPRFEQEIAPQLSCQSPRSPTPVHPLCPPAPIQNSIGSKLRVPLVLLVDSRTSDQTSFRKSVESSRVRRASTLTPTPTMSPVLRVGSNVLRPGKVFGEVAIHPVQHF